MTYDEPDDLAAARGCFLGMVLAIPAWAAILGVGALIVAAIRRAVGV